MPMIDIPIEELKKYMGVNSCSDDFDEYWDEALIELKNINSSVDLIPSDFKTPCADCFDLYFTGVRGARIHAKYLRPKSNINPHPAIIQFHGYTGYSGEWNDKLNYIAIGYSVAVLDCRGQGGLSEDIGGVKGNTFHGHIIRGLDDIAENMLFRHVFLDTVQLASIIMNMPDVNEQRIGVMGGSQGGALALVCAALEPRIKLAAVMFPFLCDYKRVWDMDLVKNAYAEIGEYFRLFDPTHAREKEIFTKLGYIDIQNLAKRIKAEVLFATGLSDSTCQPSSQFAVYNKIQSPKNMIIYPDFGHENLPGFGDKAYSFMLGL